MLAVFFALHLVGMRCVPASGELPRAASTREQALNLLILTITKSTVEHDGDHEATSTLSDEVKSLPMSSLLAKILFAQPKLTVELVFEWYEHSLYI